MTSGAVRVIFVVVLTVTVPCLSAELYWSESGNDRIVRSLPDGSSWTVFLDGLANPEKFALDEVGRDLYFAENGAARVARVALAGGLPETVVGSVGGVTAVELDLVAGKLYWVATSGNVGRANLDGSEPEILVSGVGAPYDIVLDLAAGKMIWGDLWAATIRRANLDGSGVEDLVLGVEAAGLVIDPVASKLYWADQNADVIGWADLDGSDPQDLIVGIQNPNGMAIDQREGKLYWAESTTLIKRADLDGTDVETLVTGLSFPRGVGFDFLGMFSDGFESGDTTEWANTVP
jgi:hypothetical protein